MNRSSAPDHWLEVTADIPSAARDPVIAWYLDRGADGVQEYYPELDFPGEDRGPVVSGDPSEWAGDAPEAAAGRVTLMGWLPPPADADREAGALRRLLGDLDAAIPGCGGALVTAHEVPTQDWNAEWKAHWTALPVGRTLVIAPSWEEGDAGGLAAADGRPRTVIRIDPGMAFGTGTHFTTATCLELAEEVLPSLAARGPVDVLDVGTGTGVLAIAALLLGAREALGIDVDPDAAAEAARNADRNGVGERFASTTDPLTRARGPYALVFANIVAQTLLRLADAIAGSVAPGGVLITSGVLLGHEADVDAAFAARGLAVEGKRRDDSWVTTAFRRPA